MAGWIGNRAVLEDGEEGDEEKEGATVRALFEGQQVGLLYAEWCMCVCHHVRVTIWYAVVWAMITCESCERVSMRRPSLIRLISDNHWP